MPYENKLLLMLVSVFPSEATEEASLPQEKHNTGCSPQLPFSVWLQ